MKKRVLLVMTITVGLLSGLILIPQAAYAININDVTTTGNNLFKNFGGSNQYIDTFLLLTVLSIVPMLLIMMTSFTRIIMVLSFVRSALGTQQNPPNQVLIGLALFLTFFTMKPVFNDVYNNALQPYNEHRISQQQMIDRTENRFKEFMYKQTNRKDLDLFLHADDSNLKETKSAPTNPDKINLAVIVPAFIISEMKTAFSIGFLIFLPFMIIDMVVSSILMSMGMVMISPIVISLPFKLLLFVLVNGWYLLVQSLIQGFQ